MFSFAEHIFRIIEDSTLVPTIKLRSFVPRLYKSVNVELKYANSLLTFVSSIYCCIAILLLLYSREEYSYNKSSIWRKLVNPYYPKSE